MDIFAIISLGIGSIICISFWILLCAKEKKVEPKRLVVQSAPPELQQQNVCSSISTNTDSCNSLESSNSISSSSANNADSEADSNDSKLLSPTSAKLNYLGSVTSALEQMSRSVASLPVTSRNIPTSDMISRSGSELNKAELSKFKSLEEDYKRKIQSLKGSRSALDQLRLEESLRQRSERRERITREKRKAEEIINFLKVEREKQKKIASADADRLELQVRNASEMVQKLERTTKQFDIDGFENVHHNATSIRYQILRKQLEVGIKRQDRQLIATALKNYELFVENNKSMFEDYKKTVTENARKMLQALCLQEGLQKAIQDKSATILRNLIDDAANWSLEDIVDVELYQGKHVLKVLERLGRLLNTILNMDRKKIIEMRSQYDPPQEVHDVMVATLLLLGDHEGLTRQWKVCQTLFTPLRDADYPGLLRRLRECNLYVIDPEIAARSLEILDEHNEEDIARISSGAVLFFDWALATAEECLYHTRIMPLPADIFRQVEILGAKYGRRSFYGYTNCYDFGNV